MIEQPKTLPLHAFCVVHLWLGTNAFLPYPHGSIPTTADELETSRAPVARGDCCDVTFVYMRWGVERADIEGIEIVVFGRQEYRRGEGRRP